MTQTHELRLKIDASAAKRGASEFTGAITAVKNAVRDLERDSTGAFTSLRKGLQTTPPKGMESTLKGTATAANKTEAAAKRLATSVQNSMTTASGQAAKLRAQFDGMGNTAGIQKTEAALAKLQASARAAGSTTQLGAAKADYRATIAGLQGEARAQEDAAQAAMKRAAATESLRKRHDEMFAVSKRYEASLEEIAQLERTGAISAQKAAQARARAAQQLQAGAVATGKYGQALRVSQHNVANFSNEIFDLNRRSSRFNMRQVAMQMSQVGQQGAVTGNYLQALAIQLPDLALGFGPVGIAAGAVAGVLATTLIGAMSATSDESEDMANKIHALSEALDGLEGNSSASAAQIERHLKSAFGSVASDVQSLIEDLREAEFSVISNKMQREIEAATTDLNRLGGAFDVYWQNFTDPGSVESGYLKQTQQIIKDAGLAYDEFQRLDSAVRATFAARDVNGFVESLSRARTIAESIGGPVGDQIAAALLQAAKDGGVLNRVLGDAATETEKSSGAASNLTGNIGTAADEAARLLQNLGSLPSAFGMLDRSISEQLAGIAAENRSLELQLSDGLASQAANRRVQLRDLVAAGTMTPDQAADQWKEIDKLDAALKAQEELRKRLSAAGKSTKTGGATAEASAQEKLTESIRARLVALEQEAQVNALLTEGRYESVEAARLAAEVMLANGGAIDSTTESMLRQIDAQAILNNRMKSGGGDLAENASKSLETGLKRGLAQALQGDTQNFAKQLSDTVRASVADALATKIVDALGIDALFDVGATSAAAQMQTAIITGGGIAAQNMATAIATGKAGTAVAGGGNFLSTALGALFGVPTAAEGMVTGSGGVRAVGSQMVSPSMFRGAPHYAEGTANTSGIPAILHDNEAVVPLSRGRKIPVDLGGVMGGGDSRAVILNGGVNVTVAERQDSETDEEFATRIGEAMQDQLEVLIDGKIFEASRYGGTLNPRGGR